MNTTDINLKKSFLEDMEESIRFYSNGRLSEEEICELALLELEKIDFNNKWQMHKGIGFFARNAVENYINKKTA